MKTFFGKFMWWCATLALLIAGLKFVISKDAADLAIGASSSAIVFMVGWLMSSWTEKELEKEVSVDSNEKHNM